MKSNAKEDFDTFEDKDRDPLGTYLAIGLAVAVGIGTAIILPLKLHDKI